MAHFSPSEFFQVASRLADEEWLDMLIQSVEHRVVRGVSMPTFPTAEVQQNIHGHANATSLRESFTLFQLIKKYAEYCDNPLAPNKTLLDFGCGWGRIARLFMNAIAPANIIGADPHPERVAMARLNNPLVSFLQNKRTPPLVLNSGSMDFIVSFSVFSHLDERISNAWITEFTRILRPGGLAFLTTQRRAFVDDCDKARRDIKSGDKPDAGWLAAVARSFLDKEEFLAAYDAGKFLHSMTNGTPPSLSAGYGETAISPSYIKRNWTAPGSPLVLVDFIDDRGKLPQALIVLQRTY